MFLHEMEIVIGVVAATVVLTWATWAYTSRRQGEIAGVLSGDGSFVSTETFIDKNSGLAYDPSARRLKVAVREGGIIRSAVLDPGDVIEARLYDSGAVVAHTGGGLLGGAIGGVGFGRRW